MIQDSGTHVTFCILTLGRSPWLAKTLLSIRRYSTAEYSVKILSQGKPNQELLELLANLDDSRTELIVSKTNLGCGGGRKLLVQKVNSPLAMTLDDDMYLCDQSIEHGLRVLGREREIGAVSMPQYDLQGRMLSPGGRNLIIQNGVILRRDPELNFDADWMEVEDLDGGAMLFRTEMRDCFSWDGQYRGGFDDLDKSLAIISSGKWKQAIIPKARLIHDRSWLGNCPKYERERFDPSLIRRSYRLFRAKWGLRLDLRSHLLHEMVFPALGLIPWKWPTYALRRYIRARSAHKTTSSSKRSL